MSSKSCGVGLVRRTIRLVRRPRVKEVPFSVPNFTGCSGMFCPERGLGDGDTIERIPRRGSER